MGPWRCSLHQQVRADESRMPRVLRTRLEKISQHYFGRRTASERCREQVAVNHPRCFPRCSSEQPLALSKRTRQWNTTLCEGASPRRCRKIDEAFPYCTARQRNWMIHYVWPIFGSGKVPPAPWHQATTTEAQKQFVCCPGPRYVARFARHN